MRIDKSHKGIFFSLPHFAKGPPGIIRHHDDENNTQTYVAPLPPLRN
jgi:hypothetical protein